MWVSLRMWDEGEVKAEPTLEGFLSRAPNGRGVCVAVGHPVGKPPAVEPLEMSPLRVEALLLPLSRVLPRRGRGAGGGGAPALLVALDCPPPALQLQ